MTLPLHIFNEYDPLESVVLCPPDHLKQCDQAINAVERHYFAVSPPDVLRAREEYAAWAAVLDEHVQHVHRLEPLESAPHQMFTRDVAFVVGKQLFLSSLRRTVRKPEMQAMRAWCDVQGVAYTSIDHGFIEGGDVLVHYPYVFVGVGERTDEAGVTALAAQLPDPWEVVPIVLAPGVLHLDCILTIVNAETMVWCKELMQSKKALLKKVFPNHIAVSPEQVFQMGANVLSLSPTHLCIESAQLRLHEELREAGVTLEIVDWTQIRKFGGLFRCASCPFTRVELTS